MKEQYQKVAYIGLRNKKGEYTANIPLYVKLDEVNSKIWRLRVKKLYGK